MSGFCSALAPASAIAGGFTDRCAYTIAGRRPGHDDFHEK
jgi:hypothetical protein